MPCARTHVTRRGAQRFSSRTARHNSSNALALDRRGLALRGPERMTWEAALGAVIAEDAGTLAAAPAAEPRGGARTARPREKRQQSRGLHF